MFNVFPMFNELRYEALLNKSNSKYIFQILFFSVCFVLLMPSQKAAALSDSTSDPTRPDGYILKKKVVESQYRLESVLVGEHRKIAIINGRSFIEGDSMALGKIVTIKSSGVTINGSDKQHVLRLKSTAVKTRAIKNTISAKSTLDRH